MVAQFQGKALFNSFIISPTRFGDLGGMLYGIQSEHLEETAALDGLFARLVDKTAGAALDYPRAMHFKLR